MISYGTKYMLLERKEARKVPCSSFDYNRYRLRTHHLWVLFLPRASVLVSYLCSILELLLSLVTLRVSLCQSRVTLGHQLVSAERCRAAYFRHDERRLRFFVRGRLSWSPCGWLFVYGDRVG